MPLRVPSLQLPLANSEPALQTNRQLALWATQVTSVVNSLSANPGLAASGNPGSAITTLSFTGAAGTIDISALMHFVLGGASLATVNPPQGFSGTFFMIAANQFSLISGGNIVAPQNSIELQPNEVVPMVFDGKNWYLAVAPSSNLLTSRLSLMPTRRMRSRLRTTLSSRRREPPRKRSLTCPRRLVRGGR